MSWSDWAVLVAAFVLGAAAASSGWWIWSRLAQRSAPPASGTSTVGPPPAPDPPGASLPPTPRPSPKPEGPDPGYLRTSQRVILHLSRQPRLAYGDVAPGLLTQAGMSHALSVAQPALARVLGRLIDGDAVLAMRTHVAGQSRRLKVYQLTVHGEAIARELRTRTAGPVASGAKSDPKPEHDPQRIPPARER